MKFFKYWPYIIPTATFTIFVIATFQLYLGFKLKNEGIVVNAACVSHRVVEDCTDIGDDDYTMESCSDIYLPTIDFEYNEQCYQKELDEVNLGGIFSKKPAVKGDHFEVIFLEENPEKTVKPYQKTHLFYKPIFYMLLFGVITFYLFVVIRNEVRSLQ